MLQVSGVLCNQDELRRCFFMYAKISADKCVTAYLASVLFTGMSIGPDMNDYAEFFRESMNIWVDIKILRGNVSFAIFQFYAWKRKIQEKLFLKLSQRISIPTTFRFSNMFENLAGFRDFMRIKFLFPSVERRVKWITYFY